MTHDITSFILWLLPRTTEDMMPCGQYANSHCVSLAVGQLKVLTCVSATMLYKSQIPGCGHFHSNLPECLLNLADRVFWKYYEVILDKFFSLNSQFKVSSHQKLKDFSYSWEVLEPPTYLLDNLGSEWNYLQMLINT